MTQRSNINNPAAMRLTRRRFLGTTAVAGTALAFTRFSPNAFAALPPGDVLSKSVVEVAQMIRDKKITSVELVTRCYARIDEVNPKLNAVVATCRERAMVEARQADEALAAGKSLGPLHGVPFTIKDSFDTNGVVSTGGTLGRKSYVPGKDATVVARVRAAGGILLGKTNTPEFTLGGGARGTYNLVYGQTYNPYKPNYNPSGSSGGAGSIVASAGSFFDIGSDYGGSIRGPAYANGIAGIKPDLRPFAAHRPHRRLRRRLRQLPGDRPAGAPRRRPVPDPVDHRRPRRHRPDDGPGAAGRSAKVDLKKLRVAYYTTNGVKDPSSEIQSLVKKSADYFSSLGCKVTQDQPPKMKELSDIRQKYSSADGGDHMRRMLKKHGTTQASPGLRVDGHELPSADFTRLLEEMDAIKSEQLTWLEQYDLILCPASAEPARPVPVQFVNPPDAPASGGNYTSQYNTTGWPAGVVRVGTSSEDSGMPLGVQVVGQPWRDDVVLAAMAYLESKGGGWQMPPL